MSAALLTFDDGRVKSSRRRAFARVVQTDTEPTTSNSPAQIRIESLFLVV